MKGIEHRGDKGGIHLNIIARRISLKVRPGSGFYQFSCILGNMSCLCIHLVTLFNLPCKKKKIIEFFFYIL